MSNPNGLIANYFRQGNGFEMSLRKGGVLLS